MGCRRYFCHSLYNLIQRYNPYEKKKKKKRRVSFYGLVQNRRLLSIEEYDVNYSDQTKLTATRITQAIPYFGICFLFTTKKYILARFIQLFLRLSYAFFFCSVFSHCTGASEILPLSMNYDPISPPGTETPSTYSTPEEDRALW